MGIGTKMKRFTLTEEHIALLRNAYVEWGGAEFGAPCIDPKRPYGDSDPLPNIAEILGEKASCCPHCGEALEDSDEDRLMKLHKETETALQIVLSTGSFIPGSYVCSEYMKDWKYEDAQERMGGDDE